MIKYGTVYIPCHTSDSEEWLSRYIDPEDVFQIDWQTRNHSLSHLGVQDPPPVPRIRVGVLHWPVCASSFAHMHLLATDDQIGEIRQVQDGRGYTLELTDGISGHVISPTMYLLPPRPLASIPGYSQFWLLTLVDERYYWWQQSVTIEANNSITWASYFSTLGASLGISIGAPAIDDAYQTPSNRFTAYSQPIPVLLDAAARAVGLRFVAEIDGTYSLDNAEIANDFNASSSYYSSWLAGRGQGKPELNSSNQFVGTVNDQVPRVIIPESVQVLFGRKRCGVYSTEPYRINVYLNPDTDEIGAFVNNADKPATLQNYNATGSGSYPIVGDLTALFDSSAGSVPSNYDELVLYAKRTARDWYSWQCFYQDINHAGIIDYELHGCDEVAQWTYKKGMVSTRVTRARWNDRSLGKFRVSSEPGLLSAQLSPRDPRAEECSFSFNYGGYSGTFVESINIPVFQDFCITTCDAENFGECVDTGGCSGPTTTTIQLLFESSLYGTFLGNLEYVESGGTWALAGVPEWSDGTPITEAIFFYCDGTDYQLQANSFVWTGSYDPATGIGLGTITINADTNVSVTLQGGTCSGTGTGSGGVCTGISEIKVRVRDWSPVTQQYVGENYCIEPLDCDDEFCINSSTYPMGSTYTVPSDCGNFICPGKVLPMDLYLKITDAAILVNVGFPFPVTEDRTKVSYLVGKTILLRHYSDNATVPGEDRPTWWGLVQVENPCGNCDLAQQTCQPGNTGYCRPYLIMGVSYNRITGDFNVYHYYPNCDGTLVYDIGAPPFMIAAAGGTSLTASGLFFSRATLGVAQGDMGINACTGDIYGEKSPCLPPPAICSQAIFGNPMAGGYSIEDANANPFVYEMWFSGILSSSPI